MTGPFPILVLGPGRCGSSTVAKWLIDLGVNMGARFRAADAINPHGYWEDLDWRDLNAAYLDRVIPEDWYCWLAERLYRERAWRPAAPVGHDANEWGMKDPRLCDTLALLQRRVFGIFTEVFQPRFIRLRRDPEDVAASMTRCFGFPHEEVMRVIRKRAYLLDQALVDQTVLDIQFVDIVSGEARDIIKEWL